MYILTDFFSPSMLGEYISVELRFSRVGPVAAGTALRRDGFLLLVSNKHAPARLADVLGFDVAAASKSIGIHARAEGVFVADFDNNPPGFWLAERLSDIE